MDRFASRRRAIAFALLLALALLGTQAIGLAHRVLHGGAAATAVAAVDAADPFGHAPGLVCPLYDELSSGDPIAAHRPAVLAHAPAMRPAPAPQPASHCGAAPRAFLARAPPRLSA